MTRCLRDWKCVEEQGAGSGAPCDEVARPGSVDRAELNVGFRGRNDRRMKGESPCLRSKLTHRSEVGGGRRFGGVGLNF